MSIKIDGSKVRFWCLKKDAVRAAKAVGWSPADVIPVHTRFSMGYAISVPGPELTFLSRERFGELYASRNGVPRVSVQRCRDCDEAVPSIVLAGDIKVCPRCGGDRFFIPERTGAGKTGSPRLRPDDVLPRVHRKRAAPVKRTPEFSMEGFFGGDGKRERCDE